jgi:hypothetical protein
VSEDAGRPAAAVLRVGVALDAPVTSSWTALLLGRLEAEPGLELAAVGFAGGEGTGEVRRVTLLLRLYMWADRHVFKSRTDALRRVDVSPLLEGKPVLELAGADSPAPDSDVDIVVDLRRSSRRLRRVPPRGVLTVDHGDPRFSVAGLPLLGEFLAGEAVAESTVWLTTAGDRRRCLRRSTLRVDDHSFYRTQNVACWKESHLLLRSLRDLRDGRGAAGPETGREEVPSPARQPSNWATVRHLAVLVPRLAASRIRSLLFREEWFIGFGDPTPASPAPDLRGFAVVEPAGRRSYADPFVFERQGRHHVFVEDVDVRTGRGVISTFELPRRDRAGDAETVLARDYHLSYPFVFAVDGTAYMVPESAQNRTVDLYRADSFPRSWVFVKTLLRDVAAVDATIVEHAGRLWLFTNLLEHGTAFGDELSVFHASSLFDEWTEHSMNPVVSDVRRARPAGRFLRHGGMLIRPGQDSSVRYGGAVVLNRIDVLTEHSYHETPIARIGPEWRPGNRGTHTYNCDEEFGVVDGRRWVVRTGIAPAQARLARRRLSEYTARNAREL